VNLSPYADGWFFRVKLSEVSELEDMMDASDYQSMVDES
jgi:glycine cleavage system H protein